MGLWDCGTVGLWDYGTVGRLGPERATMTRNAISDRIAKLDPDRDHQEIARLLSQHVFSLGLGTCT